MNALQKHQIREHARDYLSRKNLTVLFEAMMTGLMVEKPDDPYQFIIDALTKCKSQDEPIRWDQFITRKGGLFNVLQPIGSHTSGDSKKESLFISMISLPGLDKNEHARIIADKYGFIHISVRDVLNERAEQNDDVAQQIKESISQGQLVPTNIVVDVLKEYLNSHVRKTTKILLNGFPRTREQAELMELNFRRPSLLIYVNNSQKLIGEDYPSEDNEDSVDEDSFEHTRRQCFVTETLPMLDKLEWETTIVDIDVSANVEKQHDNVYDAINTLN